MWNSYKKELAAIVAALGLISYAVYVVAAPVAAPVKKEAAKPADKKTPPALGVIEGKEVKKPAGKEVKKPVTTKEIVVKPDPKKDPNRKKPTLKAKYADKK